MTAILKVDTIQDTSGNNIINESSDTITIGAAGDTVDVPGTEVKTNKVSPTSGTSLQIGDSGDTVNIVGTLQNNGSALAGGITVADQWRLTADKANVDTSYTAFDSNLERVDTSGQGTIGTAMSESSGIFTFPSTGIYLVKGEVTYAKDANRRYTGLIMKITTNNSSYSALCEGYETINPPDGNDAYSYVSVSSLIDVTDTTNVKVQFGGSVPGAVTAIGDTAKNMTVFTFIRLGDT